VRSWSGGGSLTSSRSRFMVVRLGGVRCPYRPIRRYGSCAKRRKSPLLKSAAALLPFCTKRLARFNAPLPEPLRVGNGPHTILSPARRARTGHFEQIPKLKTSGEEGHKNTICCHRPIGYQEAFQMSDQRNARRVLICEGCLQRFAAGPLNGEVLVEKERLTICPECLRKGSAGIRLADRPT
jgi:hypothetical protein